MSKAIKYTSEQLDFIKANCTMTRSDLAKAVNQKFGTNFTVDQIKGLCTRNKWISGRTGCFEKGNKPWNTGTKGICKPNSGNFKKGQITWNKKPIGYERICSKDGYVLVKTAEPNVFKLKHRIVWENVNGPVPEGMVVAFKNMDRTDCRIENLTLMSKANMATYSKLYVKKANEFTNETCLLMAKIKTKQSELKRI
ncbi:HNH endonuclease [Acinetobacter pittii]|jgi:hypothetical protein|uniref:HNH endonuclease n=1 Tax=Acinetobacter pittii TaxID=48296 RepID=A0A242U6M7_ACIPI|nr:HNH endonuclease signature motif containing protein [Acinetobacter pittii]OTU28882.1 HNH endonuclease [Acinetobacter pittii]